MIRSLVVLVDSPRAGQSIPNGVPRGIVKLKGKVPNSPLCGPAQRVLYEVRNQQGEMRGTAAIMLGTTQDFDTQMTLPTPDSYTLSVRAILKSGESGPPTSVSFKTVAK